ncbi:hypothetical protein KC19_9G028900 [Ceratodon purpureus]|uniref:alpha-glucosidase n=1 Tax=Ceratodon purpureus TaxID=3225 RepID=A0A8T0GRC5_CERPU|nr:hypothetical protein KC19_9G028900 [Ceratodon purpureus]
MWRRGSMGMLMWQLLSLVVAASCVIVASGLGQGQRVTSVYDFPDGRGFRADLEVIEHTELYGADVNELSMTVRVEGQFRVRVQITDRNTDRWEVPRSLVPRNEPKNSNRLGLPQEALIKLTYTTNPFGFAVTRIANNEVLFNSTPSVRTSLEGVESPSFNSMVFKDQYLEISTHLPGSATLFGLGESTRPDGLPLVKGKTYTLWATDIGAMNVNTDLYGAYPYYIDVRAGGLTHGVLLLNSNGMDIKYGGDFLTWHVIGGTFDFYFFAGPTPLDVLDQYTELVGRPAPMPYWSFGFHQCRWGYKNVSELKYVVESFKKAQIPLDTMWNDIDYMENYLDFTADAVNYPEDQLKSFVEDLHANGQHYVMILDPGISMAYENYSTFQRGLEQDIFLKDDDDKNFLAQVWPGPVYFPDFLNPKGKEWWTNEVSMFHEKVPFDGLWIDMNEVSNFCNGSQCKFNGVIYPNHNECYLECKKPGSQWDEPPYKIVRQGAYENIGDKTIAMTVRHFDGTMEYNAHNLYGLSESVATNDALRITRNKRPFILARSTFVGSGAQTAHWTGDNAATFKDLEYSIASMLNTGMVGLPMVGADICGFADDTTEELCNRWMQLGAFYPFSRNHNTFGATPQEPYVWEQVAASSRAALGLRYRLLPHLYSLMFEAHNRGAPIARPLFFAFPEDAETLTVSKQFMLGSGVMITPVTLPKVTTVNGYFPKGTWYNLFNNFATKVESKGEYVDLDAPLDSINVHLHEGTILPMQESRLTSTEVMKTPFTLVVAFSASKPAGYARGKLFIDNGDDVEMVIRKGRSTFVRFVGQQSEQRGVLSSKVVSGDYAAKEKLFIQTVIILGANGAPTALRINGELVDSSSVTSSYDSATPSIKISGLNLSVGSEFELQWTTKSSHSTV